MQVLLAECHELFCEVFNEIQEIDREMLKLETHYYELNECIADKEKE